MTDSARFWDKIAEKYASQPISDEAAYRKKLELTQLHLRPDMSVLEFGCGTGSTAFEHAPHVARYTAVDVSPKMIEIAERRQREVLQPNLDFAVGTIESYEVDVESLDAVLCLNLLHLVRDRQAAIGRAAALLKPGGLFVSSTACLGERMGWFRIIAPLGKALGFMPPVWVFTRATLRQEFEAAGFTIIDELLQSGIAGGTFLIAAKAEH